MKKVLITGLTGLLGSSFAVNVLGQNKDVEFYTNRVQYLNDFINNPENSVLLDDMNIKERLLNAKRALKHAHSEKYVEELTGTIGLDPLFVK